MKELVRCCVAFACVLPIFSSLCAEAYVSPDQSQFEPTPAPQARMYESRGILENLGYGNKSGAVEIKERDGSIVFFYLAESLKIAGIRITCAHAPDPAFSSPSVDNCADWPSTIVLHRTSVYVVYFWSSRYGENVPVANEIRLRP